MLAGAASVGVVSDADLITCARPSRYAESARRPAGVDGVGRVRRRHRCRPEVAAASSWVGPAVELRQRFRWTHVGGRGHDGQAMSDLSRRRTPGDRVCCAPSTRPVRLVAVYAPGRHRRDFCPVLAGVGELADWRDWRRQFDPFSRWRTRAIGCWATPVGPSSSLCPRCHPGFACGCTSQPTGRRDGADLRPSSDRSRHRCWASSRHGGARRGIRFAALGVAAVTL